MFSLVGIFGLVVFILARPTDWSDALKGVPLLYVFTALALFGFIVDLRLGYLKLQKAPHLFWAAGFFVWCLLTMTLRAPGGLAKGAMALAIVFVIFFLVAHGIQSFKGLELMFGSVLGASVIIAAVCVHQGLRPLECVAADADADHSSMGRPDGRPCVNRESCLVDPPEPQSLYRCEHAGVFGLTSIADGRVRYTGVLHDPNEVALTVAVAVPLAIGFYRRKKTRSRTLLAVFTAMVSAACIILTQSRGGILIFLACVGVYFLERYRWKGLAAGAAMGSPLLLLGGRSGQNADASTTERLECWYEGLEMFRMNPAVGVGYDQFTEYHHLTAHNSFVLAAAENGIIGMVLWTGALYLALKMALSARLALVGEAAEVARTWGMALAASLAGMFVGVFFLSFNYHFVLWIYVGLAGALYAAVRRHAPEFRVRMGLWELAGLVVFNVALLAAIFVYTRVRLG
jgi:O-antigen ligase